MNTLVFLSLMTFGGLAQAALPPARMIFERVVENAGSGAYTLEQEVLIPNGAEPLALKETWVVDNDHSMRVTVVPMQEPKDAVHLQILYAGGQRWVLRENGKQATPVPNDFAEKAFHLRSVENAQNYFQGLTILPPDALAKKPAPKKAEDIKHDPENFVRLGRTDGVIAWAFGATSPAQGDLSPGLWIEQDQFVIRKLRWPSAAEMSANSYSTYARGLQFPRERILRWGNQSVTVRLLSVSGKGPTLSMSSLDTPWKIHGITNTATQNLIEEFYSRFR